MDKTKPTLADVREGVLRATERIKSWPKWKRDLYPGDPHDDLEQCVHTAVKSHCKDCRIAELEAELETERLKSREWEQLYASAHMRASIALRELEIEDSKRCETCSYKATIGHGGWYCLRYPTLNYQTSWEPERNACNRFEPKQ